MQKDFAQLTAEIKQKSGRVSDLVEDAGVVDVKLIRHLLNLDTLVTRIIARGPTPYRAVNQEKLLNANFDTDLTNWTEIGSMLGSTSHEVVTTDIEQGHLGALLIAGDLDTSPDSLGRFQDFAAVPNDIFSLEWRTKVTVIDNTSGTAIVELRITARDALSELSVLDTITLTAVESDFTTHQTINVVAPANTTKVRVEARVRITAGAAKGSVIVGVTHLVNASVIYDWEKRIIVGEFTTFAIVGGEALIWRGGQTVEATTTSSTAVDLLTATGMNIPPTLPMIILCALKKDNSSPSASVVGFGLKLNTTVVGEALTSGVLTFSGTFTSGTVATFLYATAWLPPRIANYLRAAVGWSRGSPNTFVGAGTVPTVTADMPTAEITDVIIRGIHSAAGKTIRAKDLNVYTLAVR